MYFYLGRYNLSQYQFCHVDMNNSRVTSLAETVENRETWKILYMALENAKDPSLVEFNDNNSSSIEKHHLGVHTGIY